MKNDMTMAITVPDDTAVNEDQPKEAGQVEQATPTCRHIIRQGRFLHGYPGHGVQRCLSEADESGLCPVHRQEIAPPARPTRRARRNRDGDVLPWTEQDMATFGMQPTPDACRRRSRRQPKGK